MSDPLAQMRALQAADLPVHGGRTLAYVFDSGLAEVDAISREAVAAYAASNALDPTAFPSLLRMENELVGFACGLLDAPGAAVGTVTSGGTESILLAVQGARDSRPARWRDIWSAGHSTSGVSGVLAVDDLVAQTIAEYRAAAAR